MLEKHLQKTKSFNKINLLKLSMSFSLLIISAFSLNQSLLAQDESSVDAKVAALEKTMKENQKLKLSGYVQAQFLNSEAKGGKNYSGGNFPAESQSIFAVRRGRLKADYKGGITNATIQIDISEKGVSIKDAYLDLKEPLWNIFSLRAGVFKVGMSNEILQSSTDRYSPERVRMTQILLPGERDLGAMLTIQAPKGHSLNPVALNLGLVSGNGVNPENDNQKNFFARLFYGNTFDNFTLGIGGAMYSGGVYQGNNAVYTMDGNRFVVDSSAGNLGSQADRNYYVGELQMAYKSSIGTTSLSGEFWTGTQAGTANASESPKSSTLPNSATYLRSFQGAIAIFSHEITNTNLALAAKYDFYNPNTDVAGNEIGLNDYTGATDLSYNTIGCGLIYTPTKNLRFTLWYDMIDNETTDKIAAFNENLKDNVLTFRMQVKF
jgi:hypothetical protein